MTASVKATYKLSLSVLETLGTAVPAAGTPQITHDGFNTNLGTLTGATTVPATKTTAFTPTLSAGAATIDLTALTGVNGAVVDGSGLKVQIFKFINPAGNGAVTLTFGAANPYLLLGTAWKVILLAGQEIMLYLNDACPDIDATHKNIDLAGTGAQAFKCQIVMG